MNDDGGAAVAEDGVVVGAEGEIGCDSADVGRAIGRHHEQEIGNVPCRVAAMDMVVGIEMATGRLEVGRVALGIFVDVDGVLSWRKILDVESDFYSRGSGGEKRGADIFALGIDEIRSHRLNDGMGLSLLRRNGKGGEEKQGCTSESLHGFSLKSDLSQDPQKQKSNCAVRRVAKTGRAIVIGL
jgi:hypothetical protein